jgi:hypothetical protein
MAGGRDIFWPLGDSPAWWLLTRYPEAGDVFTWLDGAAILAWICMYALVLGGFAWLAVRAAARLAGIDWRRLALALVPLAGIGLFLGLSMMSATHLRAEGIALDWLTPLARRAACHRPELVGLARLATHKTRRWRHGVTSIRHAALATATGGGRRQPGGG